jgi:hypothetical protein
LKVILIAEFVFRDLRGKLMGAEGGLGVSNGPAASAVFGIPAQPSHAKRREEGVVVVVGVRWYRPGPPESSGQRRRGCWRPSGANISSAPLAALAAMCAGMRPGRKGD